MVLLIFRRSKFAKKTPAKRRFVKKLDGRRIHHIRFPFGSAGCLSCSSIFIFHYRGIKLIVKFRQTTRFAIRVYFGLIDIKYCCDIINLLGDIKFYA